jgi:hypothetical protein
MTGQFNFLVGFVLLAIGYFLILKKSKESTSQDIGGISLKTILALMRVGLILAAILIIVSFYK